MRGRKNSIKFLAVATLATVATIVLVALSDWGGVVFTSQEKSRENKSDKGKMPIAVYSAALPADPQERALRLARNSRYDKRNTTPLDELPPDVTGQGTISEWYLYVPALPTSQSDAVVLGGILDAKGYLSNDRTGAYSEFAIRIEEIFKDSRTFLIANSSVVAEREGANVRLSDGRIIPYQIAYQGMPQTGRRYVLFLKYNAEGDDYQILTGYELRKGRIFPLDEADHFTAYKDSDEQTFLNAVREAVVRPPQSPREKKGLNQ